MTDLELNKVEAEVVAELFGHQLGVWSQVKNYATVWHASCVHPDCPFDVQTGTHNHPDAKEGRKNWEFFNLTQCHEEAVR